MRCSIVEHEINREIYLERTVELLCKVEPMRMAGLVDLRRWNELLREEIPKRKRRIKKVMKVVQRQPEMTLEERVHLRKDIVDSPVFQ